MATYPTNPALAQGVAGTAVDPTNWNKFVDNINAIGADLVDARGDGQAFPGVDHTAAQSSDIDDILQALKHMIADITGETNWYDEVDIALSTIARGSITFGNDDATPSITTAGRPVGMCHTATANTTSLDVTDLDNGSDGQIIIVIGGDNANKTTLKAQSVEPTSSLVLRSDWEEAVGYALVMIYDSGEGEWIEISRSPEAGGGGGGTDNTFIKSDASGGAQTVNLPTAAGREHELYTIAKSDNSANLVTVDPYSAETIGAATTWTLKRQYEAVGIMSDGANWWRAFETGSIVNVKDFGATGNGVTDDTTAIQNAITACSSGDIVYFPRGNYYVSSVLSITDNILVRGDGFNTQIYQSTNNHLFSFTCTGRFVIEDMRLGGEGTTAGKCLIYAQNAASHCKISNIWMKGSYYGIGLYGVLFAYIVSPKSTTLFYRTVTATSHAWIHSERYGGRSVNGLTIIHPIFQTGGLRGIDLTDSAAEGDFAILGGCIEGMSAGGRGIYISGYSLGGTISGTHLETSDSLVELVNSNHITLTGMFIPGLTISGCRYIRVQNCYLHGGITATYSTQGLVVEDCSYLTMPDISARSATVGDMYYTGDSTYRGRSAGIPNRSYRSICDGDLEAWAGGVPIGFTAYPTAAAVAEETTIVRFGGKSAKIEVPAGQTQASIRFALDATKFDNSESYLIQMVTVKVWVYKPSVDGFNPMLTMKYSEGQKNASTFTIDADTWTPIRQTFEIAGAWTNPTVQIGCISASPGDKIYVDGIEILEGDSATPYFDDSRGLDGNFRVTGHSLRGGEVSAMTGDETFAYGDGNIFIKDPGGAARNFNPSGSFPELAEVVVINTADAAETITFDNGGLGEAVAQNERGWFVYDGSNWRKVYVGS